MNEFTKNNNEILHLVAMWENRLLNISQEQLIFRKNNQNRTIKQILGHLIDSASNNTHRIIHLQYQESPLIFPDYANFGNNDKWIDIQNYQDENWHDLLQLWKYSNLHLVHIINNVNHEKLQNEWISATNKKISLNEMIFDYLAHFKLHLDEIEELILEEK